MFNARKHKLHIQNLFASVPRVRQPPNMGMPNTVIIRSVFQMAICPTSFHLRLLDCHRNVLPSRRRTVFKRLYFHLGHSHRITTSIKPPFGIKAGVSLWKMIRKKRRIKQFFSVMSRCCHPWHARLSLMHKSLRL